MHPQVSVIIPMRNAERFVGETLDSILCETRAAIEVIIVDDRSSDGSVKAVLSRNDDRVRLVPGPGEGISAALNVGLEAARGSVIMRCDADDIYSRGRIRRQLDWLDAHPDYGSVCGGFWVVDDRGRSVTELPTGPSPTDITPELLRGHTRTHLGTFAIRAEIARQVGRFRPFFVTAEDIDYELRLAERAPVMYLPEPLYGYRLHGDSITHSQNRGARLYYKRCAISFQKQRSICGRDDLETGCEPPALTESEAADGAEDHILSLLTGAAWAAHAEGKKVRAIRVALRALRYERFSYRVWRNLAVLALKPARVVTS